MDSVVCVIMYMTADYRSVSMYEGKHTCVEMRSSLLASKCALAAVPWEAMGQAREAMGGTGTASGGNGWQ